MEQYQAIVGYDVDHPAILDELQSHGWVIKAEIPSPAGASEDYQATLRAELATLDRYGYDYVFGPPRPLRDGWLTLLIRWRFN